MQATLWVSASKLSLFQTLVKQHNLRFVGTPSFLDDKARISVDSDHLPPGGCNAFWRDWERANTPIVETSTPKWKRFLRRIGFKF